MIFEIFREKENPVAIETTGFFSGSRDQNRYLIPRISSLKKLKIVEIQHVFGRIYASKTCSFDFLLKIGCDQNGYFLRGVMTKIDI